eukprot:1147096-Pelagomonas_calceolata.AAC.2
MIIITSPTNTQKDGLHAAAALPPAVSQALHSHSILLQSSVYAAGLHSLDGEEEGEEEVGCMVGGHQTLEVMLCQSIITSYFHIYQFKQLGLDHQRANTLAKKLHAHPVLYANKLVTTRCFMENNYASHSQVLEPGASNNPPLAFLLCSFVVETHGSSEPMRLLFLN